MARARSTAKKADDAWKAVVRIAHKRDIGVPDHEDKLDRRYLMGERGLTAREYNDLWQGISLVRTVLGRVPPLPPKGGK